MNLMTAFKLLYTPLSFWYIVSKTPRSDVAVSVYIFIFWLQGGAANNAAYILANRMVSPENRTRSGSFMAFVFQAACLVGLAVAFLIQQAMDPFKSEWS